jgi:HipA-like protein
MGELIVQLAGRRAGRLTRKDNGNLQFRYDEGYAGPPVSYAMPVQEEGVQDEIVTAIARRVRTLSA